jgi:hypothetical protein
MTRPANLFFQGDAVNKAGGGIFAMELKSTWVKVWYIPRNQMPSDIASGQPNPNNWPKLMAMYDTVYGGCLIPTLFKKQTTVNSVNAALEVSSVKSSLLFRF